MRHIIVSIYKFYTVLPNKGRGVAPVFKLQFPKELERSSLLLGGGPLDILGGGMSDPKKNSYKKLNYKKKFLYELEERKKNRATS